MVSELSSLTTKSLRSCVLVSPILEGFFSINFVSLSDVRRILVLGIVLSPVLRPKAPSKALLIILDSSSKNFSSVIVVPPFGLPYYTTSQIICKTKPRKTYEFLQNPLLSGLGGGLGSPWIGTSYLSRLRYTMRHS